MKKTEPTTIEWKARQDAIRVLQTASAKVARSGQGFRVSSEALTHLHNAVFYILTGRASANPERQ